MVPGELDNTTIARALLESARQNIELALALLEAQRQQYPTEPPVCTHAHPIVDKKRSSMGNLQYVCADCGQPTKPPEEVHP